MIDIIKIDDTFAEQVMELIHESYLPLLKKYHDNEQSPANKGIDRIIQDLNRKNSDAYIFKLKQKYIGYVRIDQRNPDKYSISDLCILPNYQGNGYAQYVLKEIEKMYPRAVEWSLVTIKEEKRDCHLYEKLGYEQMGILQKVNEWMTFVLYKKSV
jgi:ribosomal protein S18 acetylase RimI-like enzyme